MLATFRPHRHVKMVWRVANMSETSRACRARGICRTTPQTGNTIAADCRPINRGNLNGEVVQTMRMLRGSHEETAPVEFSLNAVHSLDECQPSTLTANRLGPCVRV